ncbi:hypothetical protein SEPCBS119000_006690 [Sporothrix epigloea]|uniref:Protein kinase domain-containing protein n=1 Tax=Sporothrix epigloea TaxID=1892477 RepID=A0ABP0E7J0_9PEZI
MGPSVNFMVEEIPQTKPRTVDTDDRYPPEMGRSILKQSLQALAFLHENGIAHGDFQPGNMLFSLDDIDSVPEDQLRQTEETWKEYTVGRDSMSPVERLDGKTDLWAPRYLCSAHPLSAFTKHTAGFKIKLSDLGSGALPEDIMKQWERSALYFTPEGKLYNCRLGGMKDKPYMFEQQSLEKRFDAAAPDLDEKEATAVKALIRRILQYDPAKRPTPSELLQDPWFRDIDDAGNLTS